MSEVFGRAVRYQPVASSDWSRYMTETWGVPPEVEQHGRDDAGNRGRRVRPGEFRLPRDHRTAGAADARIPGVRTRQSAQRAFELRIEPPHKLLRRLRTTWHCGIEIRRGLRGDDFLNALSLLHQWPDLLAHFQDQITLRSNAIAISDRTVAGDDLGGRSSSLLPAKSAAQTLSVRTPTFAEADALLEPGVVAAARRRADALSMPPEWERRETRVSGASRAVYWQGVLHVYNSDGFRMIGSPPTKDPSLFRVLVLGDSLTYGDGIEERFTYSRQLERLLRRRWRVEIVDAGVDGAQSEDIVRIARRLVPELQPDLVIYGVCLNDFLPSGVGQYDASIRLPQFIRSRTRIGPVAELLISSAAIQLGITRDFYDDILHGIPKYRERFARDARDLNSFVREHEIPP